MISQNLQIILFCAGLAFAFLTLIWFRVGRKRYESFIKNPFGRLSQIVPPEWVAVRTPEKIIWNITTAEVQPSENVQCVAFSLHELMQSPPLNVPNAPPIEQLFDAISRRDDQKGQAKGTNPIGAMKFLQETGLIGKEANFFTNILRRCGFRHSFFNFAGTGEIKEYVREYAPVIATIGVSKYPAISADGILYAMNGEYSFGHSILIYGFDDALFCPDGTSGAFRVRWHLPFFGETDGWLPFSLAARIIQPQHTYGFKI